MLEHDFDAKLLWFSNLNMIWVDELGGGDGFLKKKFPKHLQLVRRRWQRLDYAMHSVWCCVLYKITSTQYTMTELIKQLFQHSKTETNNGKWFSIKLEAKKQTKFRSNSQCICVYKSQTHTFASKYKQIENLLQFREWRNFFVGGKETAKQIATGRFSVNTASVLTREEEAEGRKKIDAFDRHKSHELRKMFHSDSCVCVCESLYSASALSMVCIVWTFKFLFGQKFESHSESKTRVLAGLGTEFSEWINNNKQRRRRSSTRRRRCAIWKEIESTFWSYIVWLCPCFYAQKFVWLCVCVCACADAIERMMSEHKVNICLSLFGRMSWNSNVKATNLDIFVWLLFG